MPRIYTSVVGLDEGTALASVEHIEKRLHIDKTSEHGTTELAGDGAEQSYAVRMVDGELHQLQPAARSAALSRTA